jgi:hypothetical protein
MTATQIESGTWPDNARSKALFSGLLSKTWSVMTNIALAQISRQAVSIKVAQCANVSQAVNFHFGSSF